MYVDVNLGYGVVENYRVVERIGEGIL